MLLSPKQIEYVREANHRWNFKGGATRSGKTYLDYRWIIPMRIRERIVLDGLAVILGVTKSTIERNVLEPMRNVYGDALVGSISSDNTVNLFGEKCYALGAEKVTQVSKIRGASIKYCYGDETADWSDEVFELLKSRLDKEYSCFDGTYNPQYPGHWLKNFLDSGADIYSQSYSIDDNPFLPDSFKANLKREYEGTVYYDRYILGRWVLAEGLVYRLTESSIVDTIPDSGEYYISIDYGTENPFSAGLWCVNGDIATRIREYYYNGREMREQKTDEDYCDEVQRLADGYQIKQVVTDPSAASMIAALRKRGLRVKQANNEVADGIRRVSVYLKNGNIKIHRSCRDSIREFGLYRWDKKNGADKVIKENDHCVTGDTIINTADGNIPIKELVGKSGFVWSYNMSQNHAELRKYYSVRETNASATVYKLTLEDGRIIRATEDHPILTQRGYVLLKYLKSSDKILDISDDISYNNGIKHGGAYYDSIFRQWRTRLLRRLFIPKRQKYRIFSLIKKNRK